MNEDELYDVNSILPEDCGEEDSGGKMPGLVSNPLVSEQYTAEDSEDSKEVVLTDDRESEEPFQPINDSPNGIKETVTDTGIGESQLRKQVADFLARRPDLQGQPLPDEVAKAVALEGRNLETAYAEYEAKCARADAVRIQHENRILKQNAVIGEKAPVKGVSGGGATDTMPRDDFLTSFVSYGSDW